MLSVTCCVYVTVGSAPGAEEEVPKKGLFALPFMARALERKRQLAMLEATATLNELEGGAPANGEDSGFRFRGLPLG